MNHQENAYHTHATMTGSGEETEYWAKVWEEEMEALVCKGKGWGSDLDWFLSTEWDP